MIQRDVLANHRGLTYYLARRIGEKVTIGISPLANPNLGVCRSLLGLFDGNEIEVEYLGTHYDRGMWMRHRIDLDVTVGENPESTEDQIRKLQSVMYVTTADTGRKES